jgi:hypothetical protein
MSAIGSEFEFMKPEAAIANAFWLFLSRKMVPIAQATLIEVPVTTTKPSGTIQSSLIFCGLSENATLLKTAGGSKSASRGQDGSRRLLERMARRTKTRREERDVEPVKFLESGQPVKGWQGVVRQRGKAGGRGKAAISVGG